MNNKKENNAVKEFKIGDLFRKVSTKKINYTNQTVPKAKNKYFTIPVTASSSSNNSIAGYVREEECDVLENMITVCSNGCCKAFYQNGKFSVLQDSYAIEFIEKEVSQEVLLYFLVLINKVLTKYSWNNKSGWNKIKHEKISVPLDKKSGSIDFSYMEMYIKKVEEMYIKKVDVYLKTMGYKDVEDCLLQKQEKEFIKGSVPFKKIKITDIFRIGHGVRQTKNDRVKGDIPLLTAKDCNNGVAEYISNPLKLFEGNTVTINMFGKCFYQSEQYAADDNIYVLENQNFTQNQLLYITTILNKSLSNFYSYGKQFRMKELIKVEIDLPYNKETGELNTEYMEEYIEIIKKMIIKNLRHYIDEQLNALKAIISFKEYNEKS